VAPFDYEALRQPLRGNDALDRQQRLQREMAMDVVAKGRADAGGVRRAFISNPDLVRLRLAAIAAAPPLVPNLLYGGGAEGYTDYPARVSG
jgi:N-ethylmaleimide reductase